MYRLIGFREKDEGQYNQMRVTNYAHGGAMMVSKKVVNEVGLLHEPFFLYYEEFDWCNQIKKKGYKVYYHLQKKYDNVQKTFPGMTPLLFRLCTG